MYQSPPFSSHTMVHLVGSYQANGQYLPLQSHGPYYNNSPAGAHQDSYNQFNRNASNHNRQRLTQQQQSSYQHEFSQRYNNGHKVNSSTFGLHHSRAAGGGGDASNGGAASLITNDWSLRLNSPNYHHHHHHQHHHHHHHQHHQHQNNHQQYSPATPQRLSHHSSNSNLSVTPIGSRVNNYYRPMDGSAGKRSNWNVGGNNKLGKRHQAYHGQQQQQQQQQKPQQSLSSQQTNDSASCSNSDSSFGSRSPTPNKHYKEASQNESSDERDSLHSSTSEPKNKQNKNVRSNNSRGNLVSSVSTSNLCQSFRQSNENLVQGHQNRRKFATPKTSPNGQRQRGKKFNTGVLPEMAIYPKLICSPAERFIEESYLSQYKEPTNMLTGSPYDDLSKAVWEKFEENQLKPRTFLHKMYLWRHLFFFIKTRFPVYSLFMVGSTLNGFGTEGSDIDMCLHTREMSTDQKNEAICRLGQIMACLKRSDFVTHLELIQARVPILKIHERAYNLDVDLNFNNVVGIRNTHLMYCYSRIDWRVRPLVLVIKMWAQCQNINDAKNMTLSSYSLVLMVIHFLQSGVNPSVLPCLHNLFKGKFQPFSDILNIDIHEELEIPSDALQPLNTQTLGELLIEFFRYYDSFDYDQYAISVRVAGKIPIETCRYVRAIKNDPFQWKYMCIEEPFDFTNTARSVYDPAVFHMIKDIFKQTYEQLKKTNNLSSIFVKLENNNNDNNVKEDSNSKNL